MGKWQERLSCEVSRMQGNAIGNFKWTVYLKKIMKTA